MYVILKGFYFVMEIESLDIPYDDDLCGIF